jgi:hypothetical protein
VRVQAEARVTFYRRMGEGRGEVELGAAQQKEAWPGEGHGKGAASQPRCQAASGIAGRVASVRLDKGDCRGERRSHGRGPIERGSWWLAAGKHHRPGGRRPLPLSGTEQGREREKGLGFKLNFSKNF